MTAAIRTVVAEQLALARGYLAALPGSVAAPRWLIREEILHVARAEGLDLPPPPPETDDVHPDCAAAGVTAALVRAWSECAFGTLLEARVLVALRMARQMLAGEER